MLAWNAYFCLQVKCESEINAYEYAITGLSQEKWGINLSPTIPKTSSRIR
jgi:hypothetical protein